MSYYLPQEYIEARGVTDKQINIQKSSFIEAIWQMHEIGQENQELISLPPDEYTLSQLIIRYKKNYPDRGVFKKMGILDAHAYMAFNDQKAFSKAYFVPFLKYVAKAAKHHKKALLLKDILWNIQDETGIKQQINRKEKEDEHPLCPVGGIIADYYGTYKQEGHNLWRNYSYKGKKKLYKKWLNSKNFKKYSYTNTALTDEPLNTGTLLHIAITQGALHTEHRLEVLGRILFLEHTIPLEYAQSLKWGLRLFPNMTPKVQLYEADHITHDALFHAKRLDESIQDANFSSEEIEHIKMGMFRMYLARVIFYEGFNEQLHAMK